jgi:16S rRNA processing protein RimM
MNKEDYINAGYFSKPHGFKGHLSFHQLIEADILYEEIDHIMLEVNELLTPFFIENIDSKGKVIFKLEQITNEKEAKKIQSKQVFINKKYVQINEQDSEENLIGYQLIDKQFGEIGAILRLEDLPAHQLWVIKNNNNKEILLPVENKFIEEINHETKTINYNAPEGLISLYLD